MRTTTVLRVLLAIQDLAVRSFHFDRPLEYEDRLPNPFGGEPFPTRAAFTLRGLSADTGEAVVEWTQVLDPEATAAILRESFRRLAERHGGPLPDAPVFDIRDRATYVLDRRTGWPRSVFYERSTSQAASRAVERLKLSMAPR